MGCVHSNAAKKHVKQQHSSVEHVNVKKVVEREPECLKRLLDLCILIDSACKTAKTLICVISTDNRPVVIAQSSSIHGEVSESWIDSVFSQLGSRAIVNIENNGAMFVNSETNDSCSAAGLVDSTGYRFGMLCIGQTGQDVMSHGKLLQRFAGLIVAEVQQLYLDDSQAEAVAICNTARSGWDLAWTCMRWDTITSVTKSEKFWEKFTVESDQEFDQDSLPAQLKDQVEVTNDFSISVVSKTQKDNIMTMLFESTNADFLYFVRICGITYKQSASLCGSDSAVEDKEVPFCFEDIELGTKLGEGGFGSVFRGVWQGQHVAVKIVEMPDNQDEDVVKQYLETSKREANVMTKFDHANIVKLYQSGTFYDRDGKMKLYILLQFCENGTVRGAIDRGLYHESGTSNMRMLLKTAIEISEGMAYLHQECKVVHGDLNCNNVLLDHEYCAKVADFGLTQYFDGNTRATSVLGTVTHMAPEMLSEGKVNFKGDVYSFGVMLWEMYTGERAWAGLRQAQIMLAKMDHRSPALKIPEGSPEQFTDLLKSCMAYEYKTRPEFQEICFRLQELMQFEP